MLSQKKIERCIVLVYSNNTKRQLMMMFFFSRVGIVLSDSEHNDARSCVACDLQYMWVVRVKFKLYVT